MLDELEDYLNFKGSEGLAEADYARQALEEKYGARPWNDTRQKGAPPLTPIVGEVNEASLTRQIEQYLYIEGRFVNG
jgi:hypothetical protein